MTETDKKEEIKNILELGSSNTENYNNNDLYSYLKRITWHILHQSYYINKTPKGASNMQWIVQLLNGM